MPELAETLTATDADRLFQAEALVRGFCGWHVAPSRTETVTVRASGAGTVLLPSMYVTAVASVTDDGTLLTVEDDYTWSAAGVLTRGFGGYVSSWGYGSVVVSMTHGYTFPPAEVTAIVQAAAQRAVDNKGSLLRRTAGPFTDVFSSAESGGQVATLALLESEKSALRRYRIPAAG